MQIGVETFKDEVQLSGFVNSAEAKNRAGAVALAVPGVKSVRNDLLVK
jgi:osmotically-inducible protein OsmY